MAASLTTYYPITYTAHYYLMLLKHFHLFTAKLRRNLWRARWDLNPRSPAPKADTLIRARLRAHLHAFSLVYGAKLVLYTIAFHYGFLVLKCRRYI